MITFSSLGHMGNLGNQLFQVASTIAISKANNQEVKLPYWKYSHYFKERFPILQRAANAVTVRELGYHYTPEYWEREIAKYPERTISLNGWLQSEKYWLPYKQEIKDLLTFKEDYKKKLLEKYEDAFSKPTIAISVRRGDFVGNPNYELLPISYYVGALLKYFPNIENYNIFCFSDDIPYCRHHFECLDNVYYPHAASDIDQLCLMSMCDNFIISQSTFSWWGAYIGQKPDSQIIRPNYNMAGELLKNNDEKDYWPENWTNVYDHKTERIDLRDTTFTIPVFYDHEDRAQNLRLTVKYLNKHFDTHIIVGEQGGNHFAALQGVKYIKYDYDKFHRTKMLNEMAQETDTELLVNWDTDVIVPVMQIAQTVRRLREEADMVYPYDGRFGRVDRKRWYNEISQALDTGIWYRERFSGTRDADSRSVGGAIFYKKDSFLEGGLENEHFITYAPEDQERWYRFQKLGYKVERIKGNLYHIDHFIGQNSFTQHPLYKQNEKEFHRIRGIQDLRGEVNSWPWYHKYSIKYYDEIIEDSTQSRDEFFKIPEVINRVSSIIDIGCGIGNWGKNLTNFIYHGVDHKIPEKILAIPIENYRDFDLTSDNLFPFTGKYDLAMCMEVLEHIPEKYADKAVQLLTTLSEKILFSAAIPGQGGRGHLNEKWQTYWANLFKKYDYYPINLPIHDNSTIAIWYRNNAALYVKGDTGQSVIDYVHPELYTNIVGTHTKWKTIRPYHQVI